MMLKEALKLRGKRNVHKFRVQNKIKRNLTDQGLELHK